MYYSKRVNLLNHLDYIQKIWGGLKLRKSVKMKGRNFTYLTSIYEDDIKNQSDKYYGNKNAINEKRESLSPFLFGDDYTIKNSKGNSSNNGDALRNIFVMDSINDINIYFDSNFNDMKNYELIYLLFKIYEIVFASFYKTYEFSEGLILDNPYFKYISFPQYIDIYLKNNGIIDNTSRLSATIPEMSNDEIICLGNFPNIINKNTNSKISDMMYTMEGTNQREIFGEMVLSSSSEQIKNINNGLSNNGYNYINKGDIHGVIELYFKYILYLENLNIKENKWNEYIHSFFLTNKYDKFYYNVLDIIYKKILSFSCVDIINFLYILKRTNMIQIKDISLLVENVILENLNFMNEQYLVMLGYIYLNNYTNKRKTNLKGVKRYCNKNFLEIFINLIQTKIKSMNNTNFIKLLEYISNNNYKHIQFFREIKSEIYKRYNNFNDEQIMKLFYLYSQNINASDDCLMHYFMNSIMMIFSENQVANKKKTNINFVKFNNDINPMIYDKNNEVIKTSTDVSLGKNTKKHCSTSKIDNNIDKINTEEVVKKKEEEIPLYLLLNIIWVNAKYFKESTFLLKKWENIILKNIHNFGSTTISMLIWAYSNVENKNSELYFDNNLYIKLKDRALELYKYMTPNQLSNSLLGFSITIGRTTDIEGRAITDFQDEIEEYLLYNSGDINDKSVRRKTNNNESTNNSNTSKKNEGIKKTSFSFLKIFSATDLSNVCFAYALIRSGSKEFHLMLQSALVNNLNDLSPQDISKIAYTYGTFYFYSSYTLLSSLQYEIIQRVHQFSGHEICDILWCYSINKFFDANFWKYMLQGINFEKIHDHRYSLLYPSLSYVNLIDSSILESYNVLRIFNFLKDHYWEIQICSYPHLFANDVIDTIKNQNELILSKESENNEKKDTFQYVQKLFDFEGFLIDIYFEYKNSKYAIFLYTSINTTSNGYPLGESILKTRYVKKKNFITIHLLYDIWKNYKGSKIDLIYSQFVGGRISP
ncbi:conserved Plasmodium protein, unknown function [Plasmodium berghei]|uniref:Heptatricopeptide repeat-containing protein, putative n=2 Tax=Plasmodium berghei TaxID=5821 RepID=A0A509ARG0_PLABA|nr:heptatricopeptide repeat-containing protein, putative [Plasmodium berghei ANKA]CXJ13845.1 conserved Plasmodium protein, unknown function [Plasmodium berghei]SCM26157.1 conserved Plasmodium protein, unknown function [Plasmodium berghei]SCN28307.1 conserved Plasmodium protein, unknown function [Plasmodium berghei]SCO62505.1 conserved Plasmodium protein, unknown function [Plasmodium berghei]SCO64063.1 conserved Plasmodium protein, unknown function [Plasmodium berghei]|eukprot:XP_034423959.1 heptatricopeptide repeat-containing protein, putative [Plasmodium berghei ANKA]